MKRLLILVSCILLFSFLFVSCDGEECKHTRLELISASEGTCISEGNVKYYKCLACGLRFSDPFAQIIIDNIKTERNPDNHDYDFRSIYKQLFALHTEFYNHR